MTGILALDICIGLTVLAGGLAVVRKSLGVLKKFGDWLDDWRGEPARPGVEERPGVMKRLASIDTELATVKAALHPNGGGSLRDAVNRTEAGMRRVEDALQAHLADHVRQSLKGD